MKERLKKLFSKQSLFVFICLSLIIAFCVLYVILNNNDKKNMENKQSEIVLNDSIDNLNISGIVLNDNASYVYHYSSDYIYNASGVIFEKFSVLGKAYLNQNLPVSNYELGYESYCLDIDDMISNDILTLTYYYTISYDDLSLDFESSGSLDFVPNVAFYFSSDPAQSFDFSSSSLLFDYSVSVSTDVEFYNTSFTYCFNINEFHNLNYNYFNLAFYSMEALDINNDHYSLWLLPSFNCEYHYNYTTYNSDYENLLNNYNTLLNNYNTLQTNYNIYVDSHSYSNFQYSQLQSDYNTLNSSYTQLQSDYNTLNSSYTQLQTTYNNLVASNQQLQSDYNTLNSSYTQLQSDYNTLNGLYTQLQSDYNNLQATYDEAYNEGYNDGYEHASNLVYKDNAFYYATLNYYMNLTINNYAYSVLITEDYLNGNQFIQPYNLFKARYSSDDLRAYVENTNLSYFELIFDSSVPFSLLQFKYLCVLGNDFDYNVSFYCDDNYVWTYHNPQYVSDNNDNLPYNEFLINFNGSNLENRTIYKMTWRRQYNYEIGTISNDQFAIGYSEGVNDTTIRLNQDIKTLEDEKKDLLFEIRSLQETLDNSLNTLAYTFISSVMSTPFNILHDYLNWNFFGINLFSLFTSLITLLLVIWVIKFLLGRK